MKRRIALAGLIALTFVGASWELHPLVTRTAQPSGPVPAGCDESLVPSSAPRVDVAQIPEREEIVPVSLPPVAPPPSRSLREELDSAQRALVRNDRPSFDDRLRAARAIVATYPAGAERSRAEEVLWALNDAAVLWDAQFTAPFFDETSDAYARASRYAGYADAMRRNTLMDASGRRFYPAAESRDFVATIAAERLQRLGVRGASAPQSRVARAETRAETHTSSSPSSSSASSSSRRRATTQTARRSSPRRAPRRATSPSPKPSKPAAPALAAPSSSPDPSEVPPAPAPAEPAPTTPPASTPSSSTSADAPASPVAEPATAPATPETAATATTATTATTTSAPASAPAEKRSVIVPALLILIGLGVLIVLFRTSR